MKKTLLTAFFGIIWLAAFAQAPFQYKLTLHPTKGTTVKKVYVAYEIAGVPYLDSVSLPSKQLTSSKTLPQPVAATLYTDSKKSKPQPVFLANNTLQVTVTDTALVVAKTKLQEDFLALTQNDRIRPGYFPLYGTLTDKKDTAGLRKLSVVFDSLKTDDAEKAAAFFKANPTSPMSLFLFGRLGSSLPNATAEEEVFNRLPTWAKNSPDGINISRRINGAKAAQVGQKAKAFAQASPTGENISLTDFKGKYVLLDFWASWCGPCRQEHPDFARTYQAFKEKNFEIVSVSLDTNKKAWLGAIEKDKMNWINVSDLKGFQSETALAYGIQAIPANFLLDPQGNIIGTNLKGEELRNKLESLLDKK